MDKYTLEQDIRKEAIRRRLQGERRCDICRDLGRSLPWFSKWWAEYQRNPQTNFNDKSRAPHTVPNKTPFHVEQAIVAIREILVASQETKYGQIGSQAIRSQLEQLDMTPLPSVKTIERILWQHGLNRAQSSLRKTPCTDRQDFSDSNDFQPVMNLFKKPFLQDTEKANREWMLKLLQGATEFKELESQLNLAIDSKDLVKLYECVLKRPLRYRNRAMIILAYIKGIPRPNIVRFLSVHRTTVNKCIDRFNTKGIDGLLGKKEEEMKKFDNPQYIEVVFEILHAPPLSYGINRTTWRLTDIKKIMYQKGLPIAISYIREIIRNAGYSVRKAKKVLTSNDPHYREKLQEITCILSSLGEKMKFFSIDEFGPFAIKMHGGRSLVPKGQVIKIPQQQKSKGSLIITGALELSTNQITHIYSGKKNTDEMIKLLEILLEKYANEECIYLSWDAASWHISKKLYERVDEINSPEYRKKHQVPMVKLVPLPSGAQFLNVIESVFSGMARAVLHNSDYESVEECMMAIDRHFAERNRYFLEKPKRAGNKIWGKERIEAIFNESNNCKDPRWR